MGRQRSSMWERNRVAGATVVRRHEGVPPRVGRVYEAFSEDSGRPVLLVAPSTEGAWGHLPELGVRLTASTEAGCYRLEVEKPPSARGLPELTLALYRTARALAQVEEEPTAVEAVLGHLARQRQFRARVRRVVPVAVAACLVGAVLALGSADSRMNEFVNSGVAEVGSEAVREEVPSQVGELAALAGPIAVAPRQVVAGVGLDMPKKPWSGQNIAPCQGIEKEIKLKDGSRTCWVEIVATSEECRTKGYEWKGGCYLPSYPPPKEPQSARP